MYGTIDKKSSNGQDNVTNNLISLDEKRTNQSDANTTTNISTARRFEASSIQEEDRKRIYSHCHIQSGENPPATGSSIDMSARRRLIFASAVCLLFMIGEVVGGVIANSLAIATDAAHLLTDFASFMISLFAIWLSSRPASRKMSFGWYRAEVIGALFSVLMIWLVTGLLVYMAIERLTTQQYEIGGSAMLITASAGLFVNILMAVALHVDGHAHHHHHHHHHSSPENETRAEERIAQLGEKTNRIISCDIESAGKSKEPDCSHDIKNEANRGRRNINVRAAFIHVIGDFIQSVGVLIAALVIYFEPSYSYIDPICTFIFSIIVLVTTINVLRDAMNVLMEGMPDNINFIEVREKLQSLRGVIKLHNLRIWSLSMDKIAISTHLVIDPNILSTAQALDTAIETLKSSYNVFEITIQVEEYRDDMRDCTHCLNEEVVVSSATGKSLPQARFNPTANQPKYVMS